MTKLGLSSGNTSSDSDSDDGSASASSAESLTPGLDYKDPTHTRFVAAEVLEESVEVEGPATTMTSNTNRSSTAEAAQSSQRRGFLRPLRRFFGKN